nr:hypothetical protein [Tanacetum cinerariifolium]
HQDILGTRNPGLGYLAKRTQPVLYNGNTLLDPTHTTVSVWDSDDVLVHQSRSYPSKPVTPFVRKGPPPSQVLTSLHLVKVVFPQFERIIIERTTKKPLNVSVACFDYAKEFAEQQLTPFYEHFKKHIEAVDATIRKEVAEYKQIFDDLDAEYERCVLKNRNLKIEKKNLLIKNDCLIAECLEKDICSIVLSSNLVVPPSLDSSDCMCAELRTSCDREHNRVLELETEISKLHNMLKESEKRCVFLQKDHIDLQVKFQKFKECANSNASPSNAIFEINKLKDQLQERDETIRNLESQFNILRMLKIGSPVGSSDKNALETEITQLQDNITSLKIQNDGYKVTNTNLNKCYQELSKANTHLRTTSLEKIATQKAEIATLKAESIGKKNSGPTGTPTKPKVLASGMYTKSSKYIPPQKRADWVQPTLLPKKKQVTFLEPHRTSPRSTHKPPVQHKKPTVPVNMFPKAKPATEGRKPIPKRNTQNHNPLPAKSVKARRAADYYRNLNVDISQFVDRSTKSMHTKPHQAKRVVNTSTNAWNATKNTVARIVPIWKPMGRRFNLHDIFGSRTSTEPIVKPSKLTPCPEI